MKRNELTIALTLTLAVVGLALSGCYSKVETGTNSSLTTNRNSPEPINEASIEAELKKIETDWPKAYKAKDAATLRRILADDAVLTYPDGSTGTKAGEVQLTEAGAVTYDSWDVSETKMTVLNAESAFMTGKSTVKNGKLNDPQTKQIIDISGDYRFLDVYAKKNGTWQVVASQVTRISAPPPPPAKAGQK